MQTPYETNYFFRKDVLHKAVSQLYNRGIKDRIKYQKQQVKKFGEIYADVFAMVYENQGPKTCIAELEELADNAVCAKYGWKTIAEWRAEEMTKLRGDLSGS